MSCLCHISGPAVNRLGFNTKIQFSFVNSVNDLEKKYRSRMTKKTICKAGNVVCLKNVSVKYRFCTVNISKLTAPPGQILKVYRSDHPVIDRLKVTKSLFFTFS